VEKLPEHVFSRRRTMQKAKPDNRPARARAEQCEYWRRQNCTGTFALSSLHVRMHVRMLSPRDSCAPPEEENDMDTVLVTGSSTGIGLATALAFGRAGHTVAAAMRNPTRAPELANVAARERLPITVFTMDVDSDASVNDSITRMAETLGTIDVLVNNAGIERMGSVEQMPLADFRAVMETNYFGVIRCIQAILPGMRVRRSGCIINIASVAGHIAMSPMAPYTASKFALEALSECLAQEVKPFGIRVAIVEPGIIDTPMSRGIKPPNAPSPYPQQRRNAAFFAAVLSNPAPPSLVAERVLEIAETDTWQLRHPVGPDAAPFLGWRNQMNDEAWVDVGALDDEAWYDRVKADFGVDARPWRERVEPDDGVAVGPYPHSAFRT
jgi:NAD(P)-dependent dehydrogenase (short-subunit alcohol dehydrogenase family)